MAFHRDADFRYAKFMRDADFRDTAFSKRARFRDTDVHRKIDFSGASFDGTRTLALFVARTEEPERVREVVFDFAAFARPVRIELRADPSWNGTRVSCRRTDFRAGVDLLVDGVSLSLEDANIAAPSLIAPLEEARGAPASRERARLVSLRHAKVAQLTVSRLDLRACRFAYAHGLDSMRLERVYFNQPPPRAGLGWRWSRRQTIAEEHQWRNKEHPDTGWYGKAVCAPGWLENPGENPGAVLSEEEIEAIYRSLRKSREDSKNEPGAGDFYYGEMEMRRHRPPAHLPEHGPTSSGNASGAVRSQANDNLGKLERPVSDAERGLLWLYWLVAGYGLRASRSLAALALAIAVASVPLSLWGFHPNQPYHGYGRAILFAAESSTSLLRAPTARLSASGQVIDIFIRLAGPLLFALALLSLRGRVKR